MTLWLAIGGLSLVAILPILWPLLRPGAGINDRLDHDLEVYRDQLREVDVDLAAKAVTEQEAEEAKREIERRILRAAEAGRKERREGTPSAITAVIVALLLPAVTLLLYAHLGQPGQPDQPLASRDLPQAPARSMAGGQDQQVNEMVARLAKRLEEQPDDSAGWILLGRSQAALGRYDEAAKALRKAIAISGEDADLHVTLGDILTTQASGTVTPDALKAFQTAQNLAPKHQAARYFVGLADLQAGRQRQAYDAWLALYRELPQGSENQSALAEQIRRVARQLGLDVEGVLGRVGSAAASAAPAQGPIAGSGPGPDRAAMAAAADMAPAERQEFIESMVQRLADRLQDEPEDFDGWMRLGRAYGVLKKLEDSAKAYERAAALRPDDPNPLNAQVTALIQSAPADSALPEATIEALRKLEELQPENPRALWFLGMDDANKGRRDEAIARWQRLYELLPEASGQRGSLKAAIDRLRASN